MLDKKLAKQKFIFPSVSLVKFLKIISDNNRLKILCLLNKKELCVNEISKSLSLSQNLVSSHLKIMLNFQLINVKKSGKHNYYSIHKNTFKKNNLLLFNFLNKYE